MVVQSQCSVIYLIILHVLVNQNVYAKTFDVGNEILYNFESMVLFENPNLKTDYGASVKGNVLWQKPNNNEFTGEIFELHFQQIPVEISDLLTKPLDNIAFKVKENEKTMFINKNVTSFEANLARAIIKHVNLPFITINQISQNNELIIDDKTYKVMLNNDNTISLSSKQEIHEKQSIKNLEIMITIKNNYVNSLESTEIIFVNKIKNTKILNKFNLKLKQIQPISKTIDTGNLKQQTINFINDDIIEAPVNLVTSVALAATEVSKVLNNTEVAPVKVKQTLSNYLKLVSLTKHLSEDDILEVKDILTEESIENVQYFGSCSTDQFSAFYVFKTALAQTFNEVSLEILKTWHIKGYCTTKETENLLELIFRTMPSDINSEYMNLLYEFVRSFLMRAVHSNIAVTFSELLQKLQENRSKFLCEADVCDEKYMTDDYLNYLSWKLTNVVSTGKENGNVLLYIHAISAFDNEQVYNIFKPYIKKEKHILQFQLIKMILSLENYVKANKTNKDLMQMLNNLYENKSTSDEVKVVAIHLLSLMELPLDFLVKMAKNTNNYEYSEQVHSSLKSAVESMSNLDGDLGNRAKEAAKYLTNKKYGTQYSKVSFEKLKMFGDYSYRLFSLGSKDSYTTKRTKFTLMDDSVNGTFNYNLFDFDFSISSVKNLKFVYKQIFDDVRKKISKQESRVVNDNDKLCSTEITKLLNIIRPEEEQLESFISYKFGEFSQFMSFDNTSVESLPQKVDALMEYFPNGINCKNTKIGFSNENSTFIFTNSGWLIDISKKAPYISNVISKVTIRASSALSYGKTFQSPDLTTLDLNFDVLYSKNYQTEILIQGPKNEKVGLELDKHTQINLPINLQFAYEKNRQKYALLVDILRPKNGIPLLHYSNKMFRVNHKNLYVSERQELEESQAFRFTNKDSQSNADYFDIEYIGDYFNFQNETAIMENVINQNFSSFPMFNKTFQVYELNLAVPEGVSSRKLQFTYRSTRDLHNVCDVNGLPNEKIVDCEHITYKATMKIDEMLYQASFLFMKSNVDKTGVFRLFLNKTNLENQNKPIGLDVFVLSKRPNCNDLNVTYSTLHEPQVNLSMQLQLDLEDESYRIYPKIYLRRSHNRLHYVKNSDEMLKCKEQMSNGNYQLQPCARVMDLVNLMNTIDFHLVFNPEQLSVAKQVVPYLSNYTNKYRITEDTFENIEGSDHHKHVNLLMAFCNDLESFDFTMKSKGKVLHSFKGVHVTNFLPRMIVVNPIHTIESRVEAKLREDLTFKPVCTIDKSMINTFDNKQYNYKIDKEWHVVMHYVQTTPKLDDDYNTYDKQLKQLLQLTIFVRNSKNLGGVDVMVSLRSPITDFKLVNVKMERKNGQYSIKYNNMSQNDLSDVKTMNFHNEFVQFFKIPNNELKFFAQNQFYIVYDGERMKIELLNHNLRGQLVGLCGNYNGEYIDDFMVPSGDIISNENEFLNSYKVI